ncbi:MAG: hypothetical protein P4L84_10940 [Isosphaeraceae bacterium]|nr:hypothetical protein [Isosphaeraceae bacterium]
MSETFRFQELLSHCADLVEGEIDEPRAARLCTLLRDDPQAREFYLRFMEVHALLYLDYSGGSTPVAMPGGSSMPLASLTKPALGVEVFETSGIAQEGIGNQEATSFSARALAVAFGFGMAAMLVLVALTSRFLQHDRPGGSSTPSRAVGARGHDQAPSESAIARVVELDDAHWDAGESPRPKVGDTIKAGPFRLRSGGVTLAFLNGVVLSLDGPADLDLVAIDRVFCRQGRLRARIPRQAEGFVIASPRSDVSTIGTDFVLDVDADGRVRIKVYEGVAEAALLDRSRDVERAETVAPRAVPSGPAKVETAAVSSTGRTVGSHVVGEGTAPRPNGPVYPLELTSAYPAQVRDSHPIGYWRFTALEGRNFANEIAGAPPLRLTGGAHVQGDSRGNRYLVLPADHGEPFLETDAVWRLPSAPGHAVEFWFLAESRRHASLVGLLPARGLNPIGQEDLYLHSLLVELMASERQSIHKPGSVRLLLRSPNDPLQVDNVYSAQVYVPGRWHHVVAQKRGDSAELYLDGVLTGASLFNPGKSPSLCQMVVGRRMPDPGDQNESRAFAGGLDELALYDHPLSPAEIRNHLQAVAAPNAGR